MFVTSSLDTPSQYTWYCIFRQWAGRAAWVQRTGKELKKKRLHVRAVSINTPLCLHVFLKRGLTWENINFFAADWSRKGWKTTTLSLWRGGFLLALAKTIWKRVCVRVCVCVCDDWEARQGVKGGKTEAVIDDCWFELLYTMHIGRDIERQTVFPSKRQVSFKWILENYGKNLIYRLAWVCISQRWFHTTQYVCLFRWSPCWSSTNRALQPFTTCVMSSGRRCEWPASGHNNLKRHFISRASCVFSLSPLTASWHMAPLWCPHSATFSRR